MMRGTEQCRCSTVRPNQQVRNSVQGRKVEKWRDPQGVRGPERGQ